MSFTVARPSRTHAAVLAPGTVLGRYEIQRLLSVGGMAEIYLARAEGIAGFAKRVVIKRMLPRFAAQAGFVDMFLAEARLAATLDHPNIVQVHDIGESTGDYYYAMEYVPGVDLRDVLRAERRLDRRVPVNAVVALGRGICAGLDHAHTRTGADGKPLGVVHRDVSPSNVMVSWDGSVKVTDFGVAKVTSSSEKTRVGTLKGKFGYMSPEQCRAEALDRRSDIFGIGILLWELTTGRRLFSGEGELVILQRIIAGVVTPPSALRPDVPMALEAIILKALKRDREERYQTARDLGKDLEAFARDERLAVSDGDLAEYLNELFPPEARQLGAAADAALGPSPSLFGPPAGEDGDGEEVDLEVFVDDDASALPPSARLPDEEPVVSAESAPARVAARKTIPIPRDRRAQVLVLSGIAVTAATIALLVVALGGGPSRQPGELKTTEATAVAPTVEPLEDPDRGHGSGGGGSDRVPPPAPSAAAASPARDLAPDAVRPIAPAAPAAPEPAEPEQRAGARDRHDDREERGERRRSLGRGRPAADRHDRDDRDEDAPLPPATRPSLAASGAPDAAPPPALAAEGGPPDASPQASAPAAPPAAAAPAPSGVPAPAPPPPGGAPRPPAKPQAARERVGSLDATASVTAVSVDGALPAGEVRRAAERTVGGYRECYRSAARSAKRTPAGQVKITFEIDEHGVVRNVRAGGEPLPGLGACVAGATRRMRTRQTPDVGVVRASVTVGFTPTQENR